MLCIVCDLCCDKRLHNYKSHFQRDKNSDLYHRPLYHQSHKQYKHSWWPPSPPNVFIWYLNTSNPNKQVFATIIKSDEETVFSRYKFYFCDQLYDSSVNHSSRVTRQHRVKRLSWWWFWKCKHQNKFRNHEF